MELKYKSKFEKFLEKNFLNVEKKTRLKESCDHSLTSGGKRLRPILVMAIADAIGKGFDVSFSALAVEFFHTASLIADDLPCMDNEAKRRNKVVLHKIYGEDIALLTSYSFISHGYAMILENAKFLKNKKLVSEELANRLCFLAIEEIAKVSGIFGATNGQFLDLHPPNASLDTILNIIKQKTATLFNVSFVLGWLFGGGDLKKLEDIKEAGYCLGTAFQIADDIKDMKKDKKKNKLNIANFFGKENAKKIFNEEMEKLKKILIELNIFNPYLKKIYKSLKGYI